MHALTAIESPAHPRLVPFQVGDLRIVPDAHSTSIAGRGIDLSPTEFSLLSQLASNPDQAVPRSVLITRIWPTATDPENALAGTTRRLRRKLGEAGIGQAVHTVRSVGYRLDSSACTIEAGLASILSAKSLSEEPLASRTTEPLPRGRATPPIDGACMLSNS